MYEDLNINNSQMNVSQTCISWLFAFIDRPLYDCENHLHVILNIIREVFYSNFYIVSWS